MAQVFFDHVTKLYGDVLAVDDLVLEIHDQEFLTLVGPSGCGKSTALRCLAGLEEITAGTIWIGDRAVNEIPPKERDIAMVFQNYALYPHMDVRDNISFGLRLRKLAKNEIARRIQDAAEILGIGGLLDRKPKQLSGGQRQRVALGRAIVREPLAFLMDEPLSNLDAKLRVQTRAEIVKLQKRLGTTMIYVTHDQIEALTMGDRIAVMNEGVLQQLATPQEVFDNPANLFVATFIGSPAMNIFEAEINRDGDDTHLVSDGFRLTMHGRNSHKFNRASDRTILVGIRPEHLTLPLNGATNTMELPVDLVETMGSEKLVHLRGPGGKNLVARIDAKAPVSSSQTLGLAVDPDHIHAFDSSTEIALI